MQTKQYDILKLLFMVEEYFYFLNCTQKLNSMESIAVNVPINIDFISFKIFAIEGWAYATLVDISVDCLPSFQTYNYNNISDAYNHTYTIDL